MFDPHTPDGYIDAGKLIRNHNLNAAKPLYFSNFMRLKSVKDYISVLESGQAVAGRPLVKETKENGAGPYVHLLLGVELARFVSPKAHADAMTFLINHVLANTDANATLANVRIKEAEARIHESDARAAECARHVAEATERCRGLELQLEAIRHLHAFGENNFERPRWSRAQNVLARFIRERCEEGSPDPRDLHYVTLSDFEKEFSTVYEAALGWKFKENHEFYKPVLMVCGAKLIRNVVAQDQTKWCIVGLVMK